MAPVALIALILCSPSTLRDADRLVQEATVDYNASDFDGALAKLTEAYKLKSDPELLFDIAQCYRALHRWERAEFTYQAYLKERPDAPDRKKVKELIAKVRADREREEAEVAPTKLPLSAEPAREEARRPEPVPAAAAAMPAPAVALSAAPEAPRRARVPAVSWILGGAGAAALMAGAGFGLGNALIDGQNHPSTGSDGQPLNTITYGQFQAAQRDATAADASFIAGGVLVVTAVVWALVAPSHGAGGLSGSGWAF